MLLPIDSDRLGIVATGQVEAVMPWVEAPDGTRRPGTEQERDEAGHPLWTVHAVVPTGDRPTLVAVRVPSSSTPEVAPFAPVAFERLECVARVNKRTGVLAFYWAASGMADVRRHGKPSEQAA